MLPDDLLAKFDAAASCMRVSASVHKKPRKHEIFQLVCTRSPKTFELFSMPALATLENMGLATYTN